MDLNKILLELNWNVLLWDLVFNLKKKYTGQTKNNSLCFENVIVKYFAFP